MLARLGPTDHEFATHEVLIMQFFHGAFRFVDCLHLNECESFGTLVVSICDDFGILHVPDSTKEFEQIALGRIERQVAYVKTGRSDFDRFWFANWTLVLWLRLRRPIWLRLIGAVA